MESTARQALMLLASRREALARHGLAMSTRDGAALATALSDAEQLELREIDAAMGRILGGTWGSCEVCGGAIGRSRLAALPEVRHCEACASER